MQQMAHLYQYFYFSDIFSQLLFQFSGISLRQRINRNAHVDGHCTTFVVLLLSKIKSRWKH
jgi:hypothetical protein